MPEYRVLMSANAVWVQELSNTAWAYARLQYDPYKTRPLLKALASQVGFKFSATLRTL